MILAFLPACFPSAAEASHETERRLNIIRVSAPSPWVGTLHVKLVVSPPVDVSAPVTTDVDLLFVPVVRSEEGKFEPAISVEDGQHSIAIGRSESSDLNPHRLMPTRRIFLAPGDYVLSEIRFHTGDDENDEIRSFCLSHGTFRFDIRAQDTVFLGKLILPAPGNIDAIETGGNFSEVSPLEQLQGWRRTSDNLLKVNPVPAQFDSNEIFCPDNGPEIAGW